MAEKREAIKFSKFKLDALKPEGKRYCVYEAGQRGFGLRVEPTGRKVWFLDYRIKDKTTDKIKTRTFTMGVYCGNESSEPPKDSKNPENAIQSHKKSLSLSQARSYAAKLLAEIESGKDPGSTRREKIERIKASETVLELASEYIERYAKVHKKSWKEDQRILDADILPVWGKRKAFSITSREIVLLLDGIVDRGAKVAANRTLSLLSKMFSIGVSRAILTQSPCAGIERPGGKETERDRVLSDLEIKTLWHGLELGSDVPIDPVIKLSLKFMLTTAQRKGEILGARWSARSV